MSLILSLLVTVSAWANPVQDRQSIEMQKGCYKVNFDFKETFLQDPNYVIRSTEYHEYGLEYVDLDVSNKHEIALQHILLTPDGPLKHWRQEWTYEDNSQFDFIANNTWKSRALSNTETNGAWTQKVFQVDDSPRYSCTSAWFHFNSQNEWDCSAWAPLPRREFSQRSDYNVLDRRNRVQITVSGWVHEQDNQKTNFVDGVMTPIAQEKGFNTYTRVDDSRCTEAKVWWNENKDVWHQIQATWKQVLSENPILQLKSSVDGQGLWMRLFDLADTTVAAGNYDAATLNQNTLNIINMYIVKQTTK